SIWSKLISYGLVMVSEGFYALAVFSDPGIVTSREEKEAQQFAFAAPPAKNKKHKKKRGEENAAASSCDHVTKHTYAHSDTTMGNGEKWRKGKMRQFLLSPEAEARQNRKYIVDGILYAMDGSSVGGNTARNPSSSSSALSSITTTATGLECSTCHVPRPSRSKHCRLCDYCVRRYDHHCPWINNDVAEGTHRWFLLFIIC
ncbi:putative Zinc finger DHHC domain containing transmembrane protein, partial [Trypanosoma cruzi]